MAASYPGSIPTATYAITTSLAANPHSTLHDAMYDEIVAIATVLGTNVSGGSSTLKARIEALEWPATEWNSGTVNQSVSDISKTINESTYYSQHSTIHWHFKYTMTGSGSAGTAITLSLPVAAINTKALLGQCVYRTASTTYICTMEGTSTTTVKLHDGSTTNAGLGAAPSFAVASGHTIDGFIIYGIS